MDLEAKWQRWMGAAQHINAALKVCYRLGLCLYEMGAPDKTEMKTNLVSEGTQNNFGVFPICIAAPNFKKECFAPALLEKKLCKNCEFFPEIFRCLLVQTGFLLATMGVGYPVAFEKSHWPLLNTQWPWAFVTALPRNAELCGPIVLLYLFYSLGGGSFYVFTKKEVKMETWWAEKLILRLNFHGTFLYMWLQGRVGSTPPWSWWTSGGISGEDALNVDGVEGASRWRCQPGAAGSGCVGTLLGEETQPCLPKLNFLSSCWGLARGSGPLCPQHFTKAAAWDFKTLQEGVSWQSNRARLFNARRPCWLSRPSRKGEQQWRHLSTKCLSQRESGRCSQGIK